MRHDACCIFLMSQLSDLHCLLVEAAEILNIEAPDLYVRQSPVPNAYTLAISGKKPFIVVHTSLIELLTRQELQVHTLQLQVPCFFATINIGQSHILVKFFF